MRKRDWALVYVAIILTGVFGMQQIGCAHPRRNMHDAIDPLSQEWFKVQDEVAAAHQSGLLVGDNWKMAQAAQKNMGAKFRLLWAKEKDVSAGIATAQDLTPILQEIFRLIPSLGKFVNTNSLETAVQNRLSAGGVK